MNDSNINKDINSNMNSAVAVRRMKMDTRDYVLIAMCTALMAICSWISIPSAVPFTLQTFGVFLTAGLLGGRRASVSVSLYLLLGAVGLPVFAGFSGGLGYMLGATGGYIVGFLLSALVMWAMERIPGNRSIVLAASMVCGLIVCYAFGTLWFVFVYTRSTGPVGFAAALGWCVIPYIIPDALKIFLALVLCRRLRPLLSTYHRL